ncbi:MAG: hypothetical protein GXO75_18675 [Calditrichaeota bacterium]|nr:hypothetical protein [Calditrichota bacterium]
MDWKKIIAGITVGAIVGIAGTFFALQGRIAKLEGIVDQLRGSSHQIISGESQSEQHPSWPRSPDGKYKAVRVVSGNDEHYQVKEIGTGRIVCTTHAQYKTPNKAKAGLFSPDSKKIAVAYHYGQGDNYTWIGIWDIETCNLIDTKRRSGWTTDIYWVFTQ